MVNLEKERRDHVAHETHESRARANKRFMKETKLMEKRKSVCFHPWLRISGIPGECEAHD
ncbi:hypothetical protein HID58_010299 [Brassica napus]|uniref:Uncharacterized protein n=1 Tax=Brassica napus TaxID=3708 RepID=A0ABQ8DUV1_BRANA|nr:hypothetical protein HID58_010299 [Brassica napus]